MRRGGCFFLALVLALALGLGGCGADRPEASGPAPSPEPPYDLMGRHPEFDLLRNPTGVSPGQAQAGRELIAGLGLTVHGPLPDWLGAWPSYYQGYVLVRLAAYTQANIDRCRAAVTEPDYLRFYPSPYPGRVVRDTAAALGRMTAEAAAHGIAYYFSYQWEDAVFCRVHPQVYALAKHFFGMRFGDKVTVQTGKGTPLYPPPVWMQ